MKSFLATLQFMTRLPVPARWTQDLPLDAYARGVIWMPAVGLVTGLLCALAFALAQPVFGTPLAALLTVLANAMVTGAFHLDGLADTCDGIFSARKREHMLEIMRDSRIGTNGALAMVFAIGLRLAAMVALSEHRGGALPYIITAPVISRALISILMYRQRYARETGLGNVYIGKIDGHHFAVTLLAGLLLTLAIAGLRGGAAALIVLVLAYGYRARINAVLGGQTGDTLGCGVEVFEWLFLLAALGVPL
ncbi:adenosylcobinamide-GDP ribazoletransferase [Acerihabitans arboris]|uniref:Adenosylcobinamide-GDP ribazoletransferase n=1 Tax=Acerihabitans arboris TaxID=2691583 RepID=A0A845SEF0_9GAMM|nr:adenosylcobinamide-GDP ribazoletransferase [Acerihabitans arboris]NDL63170.1 adenosylcobinamide-GDP ribazoletransferase [Acerihabitans arboris]